MDVANNSYADDWYVEEDHTEEYYGNNSGEGELFRVENSPWKIVFKLLPLPYFAPLPRYRRSE